MGSIFLLGIFLKELHTLVNLGENNVHFDSFDFVHIGIVRWLVLVCSIVDISFVPSIRSKYVQ